MNLVNYEKNDKGLTYDEIRSSLIKSIEGKAIKKALIIPPDFTRFHSNSGLITQIYYEILTNMGAKIDILPALGTHEPMNKGQWSTMFGDIPYEKMIPHNWRKDVIKIGEVPKEFISDITDGLWCESIEAEINSLVMDKSYDIILSVGQVVPHEVIGMANHSKNLFVGVGGSDMVNKSHMVGAVYGMERMMGKDNTPVRKIFDYCLEKFLKDRPILFILTVCSAVNDNIRTHGLFIGNERKTLEDAISLSQKVNIDFVEKGIKKCVVYLNPEEFKSTWLGNKAIYRTRMAMADGGELIILAPGVCRFGEDLEVDRLIRKYSYLGRKNILREFEKIENDDLRKNMGGAAHLIHGSSDDRFSIAYAVKNISKEEIESVGFKPLDYDEVSKKYDIRTMNYGYNTIDGEEVYFIPNPALGLWINREKF